MSQKPTSPNLPPASFFRDVVLAFELTARTNNTVDKYYRIAGFNVQLRFAGSALIPHITPALEHLSIPGASEADLVVNLWDSTTTGIPLPDIPFNIGTHYVKGEIWSFYDGNLMIIYQPAHDTLYMLDQKNSRAVYWVNDAARVPYHDRGSPLRVIMNRWMRAHGCVQVHAAAVGMAHGGVLITGKGGSGKSTTALACLNSPLLYAGDDYCLVTGNPVPYVHSLYNTGKQNATDTGRFPELAGAISNKNSLDNEKALFFFHDLLPQKMTGGFPVAAMFIPQITGSITTRIKKVSPARGLLALAPSTVYQLHPEEQQVTFKILGKFARQVPNYILELGTDIRQVPEVILNFLQEKSPE